MPNPFAITTATNTISLDNRQGEVSFTVSNSTRQTIHCRASLVCQAQTAASWLTLQGESERTIAPSESQQYLVQIAAPPQAAPAAYTFHLVIVDLANPDDNFTDGPTVQFTVAPAPPPAKKPFPWWILAVVVGVLILLAGSGYAIFQFTHPVHKVVVKPTPTAVPAPQALLSQWQTGTPLTTARSGLAAATGSDGRIYIIGGITGGSILNTVEAFNPKTSSWATIAPMPTARYFPAAVTGSDGRIYVIGGYNNGSVLNSMDVYNPKTNSWMTLAPMSTGRAAPGATLGTDGHIYVIGGLSPNFGFLNSAEDYNPKTNSWTTLAPMTTARYALAATTGPDGRIYAIGGYANSTPLNAVEAYTPQSNSWATLASLPAANYSLAAVTGPDGRIYAIGGNTGAVSSAVEAYDLKTGSWTSVAPLPDPRGTIAAVLGPDKRIYVLGGTTSNNAPSNIVTIGSGKDW